MDSNRGSFIQQLSKIPAILQSRLVINLLTRLVPLTLLPVLIMGILAFRQARALLLEQVTTQIAIYENKQSLNVEEWVLAKQARFDNLARDAQFRNSITVLLESTTGTADYFASQTATLGILTGINDSGTTYFNHFLVTDADGNILLSSADRWSTLSLKNSLLFTDYIAEKELHTFITYSPFPLFAETPLSADSEGARLADTEPYTLTSIPFTGNNETILAYIIGISEPFEIENVLERDNDALPKNTIYIVSMDQAQENLVAKQSVNFSNRYGLTTQVLGDNQLALIAEGDYGPTTIASEYETWNETVVVGLFSTISVLDGGLLIEVPNNTVFGGIYDLTRFTVILILFSAVLSFVVIWFATQTLTQPINTITTASRKFADGDWNERADVSRVDEIGQLANAFNSMAGQLSQYYRDLETEVSERTQQLLAASDVGTIATSATTLEEVFSSTVELLIERFDFYHASIFLLDETKEVAILYEGTGEAGRQLKYEGFRIRLTGTSLISWVVENNKPKIANNVQREAIYLKSDALAQTMSEIVVPISIGNEVLGVLDVQSEKENAFTQESANILLVLANQIAAAVQNFQLKAGTEVDLAQIRHLYRVSRIIAQATTLEEIHVETAKALEEIPLHAALYIPKDNHLQVVKLPSQSDTFDEDGNIEEVITERIPHLYPETIKISAESTRNLFINDTPSVVRDMVRPATTIRPILLEAGRKQNFVEAAYIPMISGDELIGLIILGSKERNKVSQTTIQPIVNFNELVLIAYDKVSAVQNTQAILTELTVLNEVSHSLSAGSTLDDLYPTVHEQIRNIIGDVTFFIALYDAGTDHIEIPYIYEEGQQPKIEPFPLGEGLTSIVIRTQQPLMLVENTEERAKALGAKIIGAAAKSWLGIPLITGGKVIGIMTAQDSENENRFTETDLKLLSTVGSQIAGVINNALLLNESQERALQLRTTAEIARDISGTFEQGELLRNAINLIRDRFSFYHASVFLLDATEENAVIQESTGEAGRQMMAEGHKLAVGSQSIIGYVTANKEPLVVSDTLQTPTHRFNPLLPDTRSELGIPMMIGDRVLGALDVQSTQPYAFSAEDIEILQILSDLLAVAVSNAELFSETQEHLAQHRLIHHVTTVAASSDNLDDALASAVQGLRVTLGDRISILLLDPGKRALQVKAAAGYSDDIMEMTIEVGQGITGWAAQNREAILVNDVLKDSRYIPGLESIRSELAVPLTYRGEMIGVLNIESDSPGAFGQHDEDILGTLAGSLSAIIINARLLERQRTLFEITNKIRRSSSMEKIMETTANELSRSLRVRRARIQIGVADAPTNGSTIGEDGAQPNGKDEA